MAQALVRFLDRQYVEMDGVTNKFVNNIFGVFGHGCVVGVGQALSQGGHSIRFLQGKNEQNMALAATAFAKQKNRREIIPCVSSIGPGAMNMVTAAGCDMIITNGERPQVLYDVADGKAVGTRFLGKKSGID